MEGVERRTQLVSRTGAAVEINPLIATFPSRCASKEDEKVAQAVLQLAEELSATLEFSNVTARH